jgi:hypothetical protein
MTFFQTKKSAPRFAAKGFALAETLIYVALAVLILGIIVEFLLYTNRWYERASVPSRVDQAGITLVNRITNDIRGAKTINLSSSILNVPVGTLSFDSATDGVALISKSYSLQNKKIAYTESGATGTISPEDLEISQLQFRILNSPKSAAVRFTVGITYRTSQGPASSTYTGFAIMRNSYE